MPAFFFAILSLGTAILRNLYGSLLWYILTFLLGIAAWIFGNRLTSRNERNTFAKWGRIIGIISTVTSLAVIALLIRARLVSAGILL